MPRPITKEDIKRWRGWGMGFRAYTDDNLGLYIKDIYGWVPLWAYRANTSDKLPSWVTKETFKKRRKLGHPPARRKRQIMKDIGMFSQDEMEQAMKVMEEME